MAKILVLYHSRTGNTEKMAEAIADGAKTIKGLDIELNYLVSAETLSHFDAILIGVPTYYHDIPANVKVLLEEIAVKKISLKGKIGGVFGSYGWSNEAQERVIEIMRNKFEMQIYEPPLLVKYTPNETDLEKCREFGKRIAENMPRTNKRTQFHDKRPIAI